MANLIPPDLWNSDVFTTLTDPARVLYLYLLTGAEAASSGIPGLLTIGLAGLAESLRRSTHDVNSTLVELRDKNLVHADWRARLMRVLYPHDVRSPLAPSNANMVRGWHRRWRDLPNSQLKHDHVGTLHDLVHNSDLASSTVQMFDQLFSGGNGSRTVPERFEPKSEQPTQANLFADNVNQPRGVLLVTGADTADLKAVDFSVVPTGQSQGNQPSPVLSTGVVETVSQPFPNPRDRDRDGDRDSFLISGSAARSHRTPRTQVADDVATEEDPPPARVSNDLVTTTLYREQERLRQKLGLAPMPCRPELIQLALAAYCVDQLEHALRVFAADVERDAEKARFFDGETNWSLNALRFAVRRTPQSTGRSARVRPAVRKQYRGGFVLGGEERAHAE